VVTTVRTNGIAPLKAALRDRERVGRPMVRVRLPVTEGARLAALYRDGDVVSRDDHDSQVDLVVRLHGWQVERLRHEGVEVQDAAETAALRKVSGGP